MFFIDNSIRKHSFLPSPNHDGPDNQRPHKFAFDPPTRDRVNMSAVFKRSCKYVSCFQEIV